MRLTILVPLLLTARLLAADTDLTLAELARSRELQETTAAGKVLLDRLAKQETSPEIALPQAEKERQVRAIMDRYERLLRDNPDHLETLLLYGKFLRAAGERDAAFKVFLRADKQDANLAVVKHQLGAHLAENGQYAEALPLLRRTVELAPAEARYHYDFAEYLTACGDALVLDGKLTRAERDRLMLAHFDRAAELRPGESGYEWRAAEARYDALRSDPKEALARWDALLKHATTELEKEVIGLHRARWYIRLGNSAEARRLIDASRTPSLHATRKRLQDELLQKEPGLRDPFARDRP